MWQNFRYQNNYMQPKHISSQAFNVVDLVSYQDSAIVTKIVIKSAQGSVTLFAFDQGQELSEHTTPFDALVYIIDGTAEIGIAGQGHHLKQGEGIVMPAHQPHFVKAIEKFKMMLTMLKP
jgi:quercetin dioxygenase-like cupin family protein